MNKCKSTSVHGQPSWTFRSSHVSANLTELGGHLGPVKFRLPGGWVSPLSVAPWANEKLKKNIPAVVRVLRGDFFCSPFGGNATPFRGERHPAHGETANARWHFVSFEKREGRMTLSARLDTSVRRGCVHKEISLIDGQTAVYQRHTLSGSGGPMCIGHHAMVKFPDKEGSGLVTTSDFVRGQVFPGWFEQPASGGYQSLKPGAKFRSLGRVPRLDGHTADLSSYPARRGYDDLVMLSMDTQQRFAWTAVTFPREGYALFTLRDPRVLGQTVFWLSNGGRHYPPWNGRHVSVMGLEDTTSYFHLGLAESAKANPLTRRGISTAINLHPRSPAVVNYIMAVVPISKRFDRVKQIRSEGDGVTLIASNGTRVSCAVNLAFLTGGLDTNASLV